MVPFLFQLDVRSFLLPPDELGNEAFTNLVHSLLRSNSNSLSFSNLLISRSI